MAGRGGVVRGALILTVAGLLTRILGFAYRIFMAGAIGAEGMGLYQLILPLYVLAWSISCAGITTTVSKLVASENAKLQFGNMSRIVRLAMGITLTLAAVVTCALFFGADFIAVSILNEPRTAMSIQILAIAVPFMAVGSAVRGYFTGLSAMHVPAISQVTEQLVRMIVITGLAATMMQRGLEYAAAAAVIGIVAGEIVAFLYVMYAYRLHREKWAFNHRKPDTAVRVLLTSIATMAVPLTLNRITGSLLTAMEAILIPRALLAYGLSSGEAMAAFGRLTGMALPLIFFPSAFLISLSTSIVPAVSEAAAKKDLGRMESVLAKSFLFTVLVGLGAMAVFITFPAELGLAIYNQDIGEMLFLLAFVCPLWYYNITLNGVLNGLGRMGEIFKNNLISSSINIAFILILVPRFGILAFALGWSIGTTCQIVLGTLCVRREIPFPFPLMHNVLKPTIAGAAAGLGARLLGVRFIIPILGEVPGLFLSLSLVAGLYVTFVILLGVICWADVVKLMARIRPRKI